MNDDTRNNVRMMMRFAAGVRDAADKLPAGPERDKVAKLAELLIARTHEAYGVEREQCLNCGDVVPKAIVRGFRCPCCAVTVTARIPARVES